MPPATPAPPPPPGPHAPGHASAPAALLPEPARPGAEVVAVVPARALSWQRLLLPPGLPLGAGQQTPRLRSALEGLLEDRVLDDVGQLHFAIEPGAQVGQALWGAVCDRDWLRENLQALEAAGRRVARVVPEFAPGPPASAGPELCALGTPPEAYLVLRRQGAGPGAGGGGGWGVGCGGWGGGGGRTHAGPERGLVPRQPARTGRRAQPLGPGPVRPGQQRQPAGHAQSRQHAQRLALRPPMARGTPGRRPAGADATGGPERLGLA